MMQELLLPTKWQKNFSASRVKCKALLKELCNIKGELEKRERQLEDEERELIQKEQQLIESQEKLTDLKSS